MQIHETPDYVYFNHSAHVNSGVSCVSCHGRVDQMEVVFHDQPHSMSWCLDCHRDPETALRPIEQVTNLGWTAADHPEVVIDGVAGKLDQKQLGEMLKGPMESAAARNLRRLPPLRPRLIPAPTQNPFNLPRMKRTWQHPQSADTTTRAWRGAESLAESA